MSGRTDARSDLPRHSVSVVGIVVKDGERVLTIRRRDNGQLQPPGGVLELDETFEQGVRREVFEETGVRVVVGRLSGVYKNVVAGVVTLAFRCRPLTEPLRETDEATEVLWVDRADVAGLMTPAFAARVLDAFADEPRVRAHDGNDLVE